ncbi:hydroxypyruvate isomerase [Terriglobus roseus DSM 18391]|uniref:Hydroxypyruvate isomerase n=1 Tax=Terriglobus roseus (strain DSM 18391 / NRRL B-41598 / KBS 63) TaxID=926566 RepID=I3ZIR4_TERRK|nr:TIM barrel protein [Terriglobus roseus]AFL89132.1 hydroxypyruvate isomerase [Terriglobus roseus DSM 18391]
MPTISRRAMLQRSLAGAAFAASPALLPGQKQDAAESGAPLARKGRIKQSVCKGPYPELSVDELCRYGAHIGLKAIDLLQPEDFETPKKYGLTCAMGYAGAGTIKDGLNNPANHASIEAALRKTLPAAVKAGVPNLITFSGNRNGMSDEEGAKNTIVGLNRMKRMMEDAGVTLCIELLNSKVNHKDYMADHTEWGVQVLKEVGSSHVKLLYDIYHMQIMEGDLINTIQKNIAYIGHFHTGGVPGRNDLNDNQEVQWDGVMRGIAATGFQGYVAHEFKPLGDPRAALLQAVNRCDV